MNCHAPKRKVWLQINFNKLQTRLTGAVKYYFVECPENEDGGTIRFSLNVEMPWDLTTQSGSVHSWLVFCLERSSLLKRWMWDVTLPSSSIVRPRGCSPTETLNLSSLFVQTLTRTFAGLLNAEALCDNKGKVLVLKLELCLGFLEV